MRAARKHIQACHSAIGHRARRRGDDEVSVELKTSQDEEYMHKRRAKPATARRGPPRPGERWLKRCTNALSRRIRRCKTPITYAGRAATEKSGLRAPLWPLHAAFVTFVNRGGDRMNRFGTQVLGLSGVRLDTYDEDSAYLELEQNARALARRREHCAQLRVELVLDYKKPIQELKRQLNARALAEPRYRPELRSFYESQATRELGLVRSWADGKALSKAEQVREARLFLARHPPSIDPGVDHPLRLLEYWGDALEYARDLHERASREQERLEWELREAVAELAKLEAMFYAPLATDAAE